MTAFETILTVINIFFLIAIIYQWSQIALLRMSLQELWKIIKGEK